MNARNCTTHHYACDCREAMFAEMVDTSSIAKYAITQWLLDPSPLNRTSLYLAYKKLDAAIARATDQGEMK